MGKNAEDRKCKEIKRAQSKCEMQIEKKTLFKINIQWTETTDEQSNTDRKQAHSLATSRARCNSSQINLY